MKLLGVLLILHATSLHFVSADLTGADIIRFQRTLEKCRTKHDVSDQVLERVLEGEIVDEPNFNCFAACLLEGFGLLKPDGSLDVQLAMSKIPQDADFAGKLTDALNTCSSRKDADKCKTAHLLFVCMHENKIPDLLMG